MQNETIGHFQAGDAMLAYREYGAGRPVVLLHGNSESMKSFDAFLPYLTQYRVITMDTRGHGASERGQVPMSYERFAEDVICLLDHLGIEKVDLLGFSDGGITALILGYTASERCGHIVCVGANMTPAGMKRGFMAVIRMAWLVSSLFVPFSQGVRLQRELLTLMLHEPHLSEQQLARIQSPCLIIAGEKDIVKEAETRRIHSAIPGSECLILPGGHGIGAKELPDAMAAINRFLSEPIG